jgi:hypothetical protein
MPYAGLDEVVQKEVAIEARHVVSNGGPALVVRFEQPPAELCSAVLTSENHLATGARRTRLLLVYSLLLVKLPAEVASSATKVALGQLKENIYIYIKHINIIYKYIKTHQYNIYIYIKLKFK